MQELTIQEINEVTGAAGTILGNLVQTGANLLSGTFNALQPVGLLISAVPLIGGPYHKFADVVLQGTTDTVFKLGSALGGQMYKTEFHYQHELANNDFSPLGIFRYL